MNPKAMIPSDTWGAAVTIRMAVHEKTRPTGDHTSRLTGVVLLALGSTLFLWGASTAP
jgi:hypothetical protein